MQEYPHHYVVEARAPSGGNVTVASPGLESFQSAGPAEFGGPGDKWSPETLMVAAVADCFILTFRAIARASKLEWEALSCAVIGDLDRVDKVTRFTDFRIRATLDIPETTSGEKAERLLEKAEKTCLVTNSMISRTTLDVEVRVAGLVA